MKEAMDIVRDRQEWRHRIFNLIVTIGLTGEQEEEDEKNINNGRNSNVLWEQVCDLVLDFFRVRDA